MLRALVCLVVFCTTAWPVSGADTVKQLQEISVTIKAGMASGSGILFTRESNTAGERVTYVWTAGHVVDGLRKTREVVVKGDTKTVVEFSDAAVVQEYQENGRRIGETKFDARVLRYSDADNGEDLALLEIRKRNFAELKTSAEFYNGEMLPLGTKLLHVGSMYGQFGSNSLTSGVLSQIGRVLDLGANGKTFDQVTCIAAGGSSGGGVFLEENGQCVGLLVRGATDSGGFNLIVPVRRIRAWAKEANVEWAMDPSVKLPPDKVLRKLSTEDSSSSVLLNRESNTNAEFPFLLRVEN